MGRLDQLVGDLARQLARRSSRRSFLARAGALLVGASALPLLPVARATAQPREPAPGEPDPATRCFQALRIAVNDELGQLARGLFAAERALAPGGALAVVTFHSLEDRVVKRFLQGATERGSRASRHAPATEIADPRFVAVTSNAVSAGPEEIALNPRARSARLRIARRLAAPPRPFDPRGLGLPALALRELRG